jgi:hypothetical protein
MNHAESVAAAKESAAAAAPAFGPAIIQVFGADVPILALSLSVLGLILARKIAPPPARKLTTGQEVALTTLLVIVLVVIVTGQFTGSPLGVGMAVVWSIGLGFSGLLVVEFFGGRTMAALKGLLGPASEGRSDEPKGPSGPS